MDQESRTYGAALSNEHPYRTADAESANYRTACALVFKPGHGLEGVDTLGDPRLRDKRIGIGGWD